jgi:multiple sugar transport system substrate-binding protein
MPKLLRNSRLISKFLLVSGLLTLVAVLSGCSLLGGNKNQQVNLKYWGIWESSTTMTQIINDYKKIKPNVSITYEKRSPQLYRDSLQTQIGNGNGPDIYTFHNTWPIMLKNNLAPAPASVMTTKALKDNYYPVIFSDMKNGQQQVIGLPTGIDGLALYWNKDIFNAAGITNPPTTWQELSQDASLLTVRDSQGNIRTSGVALGTASNVDSFSDILGLMIYQNGGDPKNPATKEGAEALEYYTTFAKGPSKVWDETLPSSTVAFSGGTLAMYLGQSWRAIDIKNVNPLLNFEVSPVPQLESGNTNWASYWATGVSGKSQHIKEAWDFVKFLNEQQTLINMYTEDSKSPGRFFGQPYPVKSMGEQLATDPIVGAYIVEAPTMLAFPMASRTYDNGINDQIIKSYEDAVNSVLQGGDSATALQTVAKNVAAIFAKYNGTK